MQNMYGKESRMTDQLFILLAMETEKTDPIDWTGITVNRDEVYALMASSVQEILSTAKDDSLLICSAAMTKLLVENFVLHQRLNRINKN